MGEAANDVDRLHGLLAEVERRCPDDRRARYVCVVTLARPGGRRSPRGGDHRRPGRPQRFRGFGYDPSFLSDDLGSPSRGDRRRQGQSQPPGPCLAALLGALDAEPD